MCIFLAFALGIVGVTGDLGLTDRFFPPGLYVSRCRRCLRAASLKLRFGRKKRNARGRKWRRSRDRLLSSSCSPPSAPDLAKQHMQSVKNADIFNAITHNQALYLIHRYFQVATLITKK